MNDESGQDLILFTEALRLRAEERGAFLDQACAGDETLRREVEALLKAHESAPGFLEDAPTPVAASERTAAAAGEKPGDCIGHYRLLQQIGEGGCGVVYMAEQQEPVRRRVALKIIKPGMDTRSVIARFQAEQQALALMDHPNIAKVFDAGATASGRPYFVMELVRGVKITEYCDRNSLTTRDRLRLFIRVCQAVQHAHQKGIIHRDIKPSNILVTELVDGSPSPVIIDFGIAKATSNQRLTDQTLFTAFEMLLGTPAYMSPEQASLASVDVDTRSDIYSLGVLLYELLTGSPPFDARKLLQKGLDEIRRVVCEEEAARPSTHLTKMEEAELTSVAQHRGSEPPNLIRCVRGDLDWIVMKALEKDRRRRYETANGLARDVERFLSDEPISACPPSALYKFRKIALRHKFLFVSASLIAALVVTSLIVVLVLLTQERQAHREVRTAYQQTEDDKMTAQQVTRFLEEMLAGVGPSVALGRDTTMLRDILDRTAQRVGVEMTNRPAVEAHLRSLIGQLYFQIGNYEEADKMQRATLELDQRLFGPNSAETAAALNDYGVTLWRENKQPEAEAALKEALAIRRKLFGDESAEVATSLNDLGNVYRHYQRPKEAEPLVREALRIRQKLFQADSLEAADSLRVLSILKADEGDPAEAEKLALQVLEIRRKRLGPENPLVASSLADVAWAASKQGDLAEAESYRKQALLMQQNLLGDLHPSSLDSLEYLASLYEAEGRLKEAETLRLEALALRRKKGGNDDPRMLWELVALARNLMGQEKLADAGQLLDEVLTPAFVKTPASTNALVQRVELMGRQGRWRQAAADAAVVLEYEPADYYSYHTLAPLLVMTRNRPAYVQLCQKILATFPNPAAPYIAERLAGDCLLLPNAGVDLQRVDKLADIAVTAGNGDALLVHPGSWCLGGHPTVYQALTVG